MRSILRAETANQVFTFPRLVQYLVDSEGILGKLEIKGIHYKSRDFKFEFSLISLSCESMELSGKHKYNSKLVQLEVTG